MRCRRDTLAGGWPSRNRRQPTYPYEGPPTFFKAHSQPLPLSRGGEGFLHERNVRFRPWPFGIARQQLTTRPVVGSSAVSHVVGRYFLNIKEGATLIPDPEGDGLFGRERRISGDPRNSRRRGAPPHVYGDLDRWTRREFVVTDESGRTVLEVPVVALIRPN